MKHLITILKCHSCGNSINLSQQAFATEDNIYCSEECCEHLSRWLIIPEVGSEEFDKYGTKEVRK